MLVRAGLEEIGLGLPEAALDKLLALSDLLARWSPRIDLTGYRDSEAILRHLVLDAVALWAALPVRPPPERVADLGSGAGVPGFPIAILAPQTRVLLVESRLRRHHFQKAVRRELALENTRLLRGRIEELPPEPCDLVLAQAIAAPERALRWMLLWAQPGAFLGIPGSQKAPKPLPAGVSAADLGLLEPAVIAYQVPLGGAARTLWLARRAGPSP
jgi:16S rRNA (guanine527-N7)-methyltransferase